MSTSSGPGSARRDRGGGLRSLNKARLLERITHAAAELFRSDGYPTVTMEQIAASAEVSKRTLYKHFPAKEAILAHLLENEVARDVDRLRFSFDASASFRANASALLAESAAWCERHPDHLMPYIRYKITSFEPVVDPSDERGLVKAWTMLIAAGQVRGDLDTKRPAEQLAIYFHYLYFGALMRWITNRELTLAQEFETVLSLFIDGARA